MNTYISATALGIQGGGIQRPSFRKKSVGKCLKMHRNKRKKAMTLSIQDLEGIPKKVEIKKKKIRVND